MNLQRAFLMTFMFTAFDAATFAQDLTVGDNPAPTLTSINPSVANRSQTLNVVLRGTNFIPATVPSFGSGGDVTVNSITVDSTSQLTVNITVSSAATLGPRNVRVTNPAPGGGTSASVAFSVNLAPPPTPTLSSPTNGASVLPTNPLLKWDVAERATQYHLQLSTSSLFLTTVVNDSSLTSISRQVGPLLNDQTYYWHVRARNGGGTSAWSDIWSFLPQWLAPTSVVLVSPADMSLSRIDYVQFKWRPGDLETDKYDFELASDSTFTFCYADSALVDTVKRYIGLTSYQRYWWRVRARNVVGWGPYSPQWSFKATKLPDSVSLLTPNDGSFLRPSDVRFSWRAGTPEVEHYSLHLATDSLFIFAKVDSQIVDTSKLWTSLPRIGQYWWKVRARNAIGWGPYSRTNRFFFDIDDVDKQPEIPRTWSLSQNYPNPFNPSTTIRYGLPNRSHVTLTVFNTLGQQVAVLQNGELDAGYHEVKFDGSGLSSGVYFYRIEAGSFVQTRKLLLIR